MKENINRYLFTIAFLFFCLKSTAQPTTESFTLDGKLLGRDTGYIILQYPDIYGKYIKDTSYIKDGEFKFKGRITQPSFAHLMAYNRDGNYNSIYIEAGYQSISVEEDNFPAAIIKGSYTQLESDSLYKAIELLEKKYEKLQLPDNEIKEVRISFIRSHPDSHVSPTELYGLINSLAYDSAKSIFNTFSEKIKESFAGKLCLNEINKKAKVSVGFSAPDFYAIDINGQDISVAKFRNKYVLLDFWASWCVPCRQSFPDIIKLYKEYHSKGLEVIAISSDAKKEAWQRAIVADGTGTWYNILDKKNDKNGKVNLITEINELYGVNFLPTKFLIDKNGIIIGRYDSFDDGNLSRLFKDLQKIFE